MDSLQLRRLIVLILFLLGLGLVLLGQTVTVCMWIGIILLVGGLILNQTIRCPNCGRCLAGKRQLWLPNYCPHCGYKL